MTENKRIAVNIFATYGRSVFSMLCGLFSSRWILMSLGQTDFGLYGVLGGLVGFVAFMNGLLANAVSRFFCVCIGAKKKAQQEGDDPNALEECRKWFSVAVVIHTVVPIVLVLIGYPLGIWAIDNFLTIPSDRVVACVWVWRYTCIASFVAMISVPFSAMYTAKQEIAELTIYSVLKTAGTVVFLYYMVCHPDDWLVKYAFGACLLSVLPQLAICISGYFKYEECRFNYSYIADKQKYYKLMFYAGANFWTAASNISAHQGQTILVNKMIGPMANAAMTVGNNLAAQTRTLSASLTSAFWPAIANAVGAKDLDKARMLSMMVCRIGTILLLIFAIPLSLESEEVMILWLKNPPEFAAQLCVLLLVAEVLDKTTEGHWLSFFAIGKIGLYSFVDGCTGIVGLIISFLLLFFGVGLYSVGIAFILMKILAIFIRLYFGKHITKLSASVWMRKVLLPIIALICFSCIVGLVPRLYFEPSLYRVVLTTMVIEIIMIPSIWCFILQENEKLFLAKKLKFLSKFIKKR